MTRARSPRRGGFTLVELLVAMALAILLMALVVGVSGSNAFGSYKVVRSGDRVSGWLLIAKSRAIRDGLPRGVRFFRNGDGTFTSAQYIEVPDAWVPNPAQESNPTGGRIVFSYNTNTATPPVVTDMKCYFVSDNAADLTAFAGATLGTGAVKSGDVLTLPELGGAFRLTADPALPATTNRVQFGTAPTTNNASEIFLASMPNLGAAYSDASTPTPRKATLTTYKFAFGGAPRPLFGEPALIIPEGTSIVSDPNTTQGVNSAGNFDVMFLPSGQVVVGNAAGSINRPTDIVVLWIRDIDKPTGEQALVTVYHTGQIATHPAGPGGNPYQYVKDGLYTGVL